MSKLLFDIGGSKIRIAKFNTNKNRLSILYNDKTPLINDEHKFIKRFNEIINKIIPEKSKRSNLELVIGIPGKISNQQTLKLPPVYPNLQGINLYKLLTPLGFKKIIIENDSNARAWGDYIFLKNFQNKLQNCSSTVSISLGTGIGAGIIINGELLKGENNLSGEIGYMILNQFNTFQKKEELFRVRDFCSGKGIVRLSNYIILKDNSIRQSNEKLNTNITTELFQKLEEENNKFVAQVWEEFFSILAIAIVNISCLIDPNAIILSGGVTNSKNFKISKLINKVKELTYGLTQDSIPKIIIGELGDDAVLFGLYYLCEDVKNR